MRKKEKGNAGKIPNIPLPFEAWAYRVINPDLGSLSDDDDATRLLTVLLSLT
jgi:hypothetical protein